MGDYYDRDGIPIDEIQWSRLLGDYDYKRVARTTVTDAEDPSKAFDVSTVWLGLDHRHFGEGAPIIFETMVFGDDSNELDGERYTTLAEAQAGHTLVVVQVSAKMTDPIVMDAEGVAL